MAKNKKAGAKLQKYSEQPRQYRNFPLHTLEEALVLAQKIKDELGGKPMNRLLLADALVSAVGQKGPGRVENGPFWMIQDFSP